MQSKTFLAVRGHPRYCMSSANDNENAFLKALYSDGDTRKHDIQYLNLYKRWLVGLLIRSGKEHIYATDVNALANTWILVQAIRCVYTEHEDLSETLQKIAISRFLAVCNAAKEDGKDADVNLQDAFPFTQNHILSDELQIHKSSPENSGLVCNRVLDLIFQSFTDQELSCLVRRIHSKKDFSVQTLKWSDVLTGSSDLPHPGYSLLFRAYGAASCRDKAIKYRTADLYVYLPTISFN